MAENKNQVLDYAGLPYFWQHIVARLSDKISTADLPSVIDDALAQAKESGEFDGYSPVRGTDYWTDADIAEIKGYVDSAILNGSW